VWATSWGVSTRLVGGLIMTHSDDAGLVLPPKLAPIQVAMVPIPKPLPEIMEKFDQISAALKAEGITVEIDSDEKKRPGFKFAEYEMKGVPVRLALGPRDMENNQIEVARRDTKEKTSIPIDGVVAYVKSLLDEIQDNLLNRAKAFRAERYSSADNMEECKELIKNNGVFVLAHWDGTVETELKIKEMTKATIRCIPNDNPQEEGKCILTGNPSKERVLFAKAY